MGTVAILGSANLDLLAGNLADMAAQHGMTIATHVPPFGQARMDLLKDTADSPLQQAMDQAAAEGGRTATLHQGRTATRVRIVEMPADQARPLLRQFPVLVPTGVSFIRNAGLVTGPNPDEFEALAGRIPVFRFDPV